MTSKILKLVIVISGLFFIGNLIFSSILFHRSLNQLETKRFDKYRYLTNYYTEVINTALLGEEERLTKLSLQLSADYSDKEILQMFKESASQELPKMSLTVCFDKDGHYVTEIPDESDDKVDFRQRNWYKTAVAMPGVVYSDVYPAVDGDKYYVSLMKRIATNGIVQGAICGDLQLAGIFDLVQGMRIGKYGYAFIVSRDGFIITHPHLATGENLRTISDGLFVPLLQAGQKDSKVAYNFFYDNQKHVYGACSIGRSNWILVTYIDDMEMLVGVFWESLFFALGTFFLLGVMYLVCLVLVVKYYKSRIKKA